MNGWMVEQKGINIIMIYIKKEGKKYTRLEPWDEKKAI